MSVYRDPPQKEENVKSAMKAFNKTIKIDERHFMEVTLGENNQLYLTLKSHGLMANDSNWSSYDWFMSQLSFPPTQFDEIERVARRWLQTYIREYEANQSLVELERTLREATKTDKKSKGN